MSYAHVISVEANLGAAQVKPHRGGRSQNYMAPEAMHAIEEAQKAKAAEATATPSTAK